MDGTIGVLQNGPIALSGGDVSAAARRLPRNRGGQPEPPT